MISCDIHGLIEKIFFFKSYYYAINDTDFFSSISSFIYPLLSLTEENVNSFNDGIGDNWSMNHVN